MRPFAGCLASWIVVIAGCIVSFGSVSAVVGQDRDAARFDVFLDDHPMIQSGQFHFRMIDDRWQPPADAHLPAIAVDVAEDGTKTGRLVFGMIVGEDGQSRTPVPERLRFTPEDGVGFDSLVREMTVAVDGDRWIRRWPGSNYFQVSDGEAYATYTENTNPDNSLGRALLVEPPEWTFAAPVDRGDWREFIRCGWFPYSAMEDYVRGRREDLRTVGTDEIDGH